MLKFNEWEEFYRSKKFYLNSGMIIIHFFFGIGVILSPIIIKQTINTTGYKTIFYILIILSVIAALFILFTEDIKTAYNHSSIFKMVRIFLLQKVLWITISRTSIVSFENNIIDIV
jgi:hypothetical protein